MSKFRKFILWLVVPKGFQVIESKPKFILVMNLKKGSGNVYSLDG